MSVSLANLLDQGNFSREELEIETDIEDKNELAIGIMEDFLKKTFKVFRGAFSLELEKMAFCRNEYMMILLDSLELQGNSLQNERVEVSCEAIKKCKDLGEIVFNKIKPLTKNVKKEKIFFVNFF